MQRQRGGSARASSPILRPLARTRGHRRDPDIGLALQGGRDLVPGDSHSRLNLIQALIQAINAGADEALMLDPHGFVASCNSTNFFIVRSGALWTSTGRYNFKGIPRARIIELYRAHGGAVHEIDFTLSEVYGADEAFVTGTLGGVTPVTRVDGRSIGSGQPGAVTRRVGEMYDEARE
jgi:branched-chain amino acid aminotransferase